MFPGILAGHVDIEGMMGVLDHGDVQALFLQLRDRPRQQGGLAGAAPSREAYYFHYVLRNRLLSSLRGAKRRSNPRFLRCAMDCFASLAMTALAALFIP